MHGKKKNLGQWITGLARREFDRELHFVFIYRFLKKMNAGHTDVGCLTANARLRCYTVDHLKVLVVPLPPIFPLSPKPTFPACNYVNVPTPKVRGLTVHT